MYRELPHSSQASAVRAAECAVGRLRRGQRWRTGNSRVNSWRDGRDVGACVYFHNHMCAIHQYRQGPGRTASNGAKESSWLICQFNSKKIRCAVYGTAGMLRGGFATLRLRRCSRFLANTPVQSDHHDSRNSKRSFVPGSAHGCGFRDRTTRNCCDPVVISCSEVW